MIQTTKIINFLNLDYILRKNFRFQKKNHLPILNMTYCIIWIENQIKFRRNKLLRLCLSTFRACLIVSFLGMMNTCKKFRRVADGMYGKL